MVKDVYLKNAGEINSSKIEKANRLSHRKTMKIQSYPNFDVQILTLILHSLFCCGWYQGHFLLSLLTKTKLLDISTLLVPIDIDSVKWFLMFCQFLYREKPFLHDPNVLEAHPGTQWCADQDTEDHHDLLPAHTENGQHSL